VQLGDVFTGWPTYSNQDSTPAVGIQASKVSMHPQKTIESTVDGSDLKLFHRVVSDLQSSRQRDRPYMLSTSGEPGAMILGAGDFSQERKARATCNIPHKRLTKTHARTIGLDTNLNERHQRERSRTGPMHRCNQW
jgi:hypothetical protein